MATDLTLCGWRVRSEIALPQLLPWTQDNREPDVQIVRLSNVDEKSSQSTSFRRLSLLTGAYQDGTARLEIPSLGQFIAQQGKNIWFSGNSASTDADLCSILLGPVFAICCAQRRLPALRATAVAGKHGAIAICGETGVGKSAVALALCNRGRRLISDGLVILHSPPNQPDCTVLPTHPYFQLWRRAIFALKLPMDNLNQVRPCLEKYWHRHDDNFDLGHAEVLRHIIFLKRSPTTTAFVTAAENTEQRTRIIGRCLAVEQQFTDLTRNAAMTSAIHNIATTVDMHVLSVHDDLEAASAIEALAT